jgi:hypothetical protein
MNREERRRSGTGSYSVLSPQHCFWVIEMKGLQKKYKRNENFVFRKIGDETILVPIKDNVGDMGSIYNLNEVGAFILEKLDGENRLLDIKNMILEEFEVPPEKAEVDLCGFVRQLREVDAIVE